MSEIAGTKDCNDAFDEESLLANGTVKTHPPLVILVASASKSTQKASREAGSQIIMITTLVQDSKINCTEQKTSPPIIVPAPSHLLIELFSAAESPTGGQDDGTGNEPV
jgi:xanthine dehydrogenase molybdopterin-binding subunit B